MKPATSRAKAIVTDQELAPAADVVIIGAGILGVCTAYYLAKHGVSVTVCEKGVVAGEASCRSVGQVASAGLDAVKMELIIESKGRWAELQDEIDADLGYRKNGFMAPCPSTDEFGFWETWLSGMQTYEPEARLLSAEETKERTGADYPWTGAYYNPTDGCAEPTLAAPEIAAAARKHGAKIIENCAVRGLESAAGHVSAVITEKGPIKTNNVVLAGGAWSMQFARSIGIDLPILGIQGNCQSVASVPDGPEGTGDLPGTSWRREIDGGYVVCVIGGTVPIVPAMFRVGLKFLPAYKEHKQHWDMKVGIGRQFIADLLTPSKWPMDKPSPFEQTRILDPAAEPIFNRKAREKIAKYLGAFRSVQVRDEWAGMISTTPDDMPTISPVQSKPGLHLLTGFSYGLTMGPGAGKLMADMITGVKSDIDPRPYRYERHIDGSKLEVAS